MSTTGMDPRRGQSSAQVQTLIDAAVGNPAFLDVWPQRSGAAVIAANTISLSRLPRTPKARSLSWADVFVATAAGNIAVALMTTTDSVSTDAQAIAATFTRVAHTGEIAAAGAGVHQRLTFITPYDYALGTDLWIAFGGNNASLSIGRHSILTGLSTAGALGLAKASAYSLGIPATLTALAATAYLPYLRTG